MKKLNPRYIKLSPDKRLYHFEKPVIALTGGIATGKSTVSSLLRQRGIEIIDADKLVKEIYGTQEAKKFIQENIPEAFFHDEVNFKKLREVFFSDVSVKSKVEKFIYDRLPDAFKGAAGRVHDQDFYLYDVPLLFERKLDGLVDLKVVVYAPRKIQLARLIDRDGSNEEIGNKILDQQMDIEVKKEKADFVIHNSTSLEELSAEVDELLRTILIP